MTYKSIGLVDFSHALRVNYHVRNPDGTPTTAGEQTLAQLSDWKRSVDHLIVCLDSPPYDRAKAYPEYKGQRERDDGYIAVCKWTKARLEADGYSIAKHPGAEADDVIATLAAYTRVFRDIRIIGTDKDALQCVCDDGLGSTVRVFAPLGGGDFEIRDVEWVHKKYGVGPENMALLLAIMGDTGDNIPGIAAIGQKGAAKLITEFGTITKMNLAAVDAVDKAKESGKPLASFWKKFLDGSPRLPEWLALTTLRTDVPLDVDALLLKRAPAKLVDEHGDAWEPSAEELEAERELLDPEELCRDNKSRNTTPGVACGSGVAIPTITSTSTTAGAVSLSPRSSIAMNGSSHISGAGQGPVIRSTASTMPGTTSQKTSAGQQFERTTSTGVDSGSESTTHQAARESFGAGTNGTQRHTAQESGIGSGRMQHQNSHSLQETNSSIVVDRPAPPSWALALQPATAKEALQIAAVLFNSRVCSQFGSERGVYAVISLGRELGLGMMAALQGFHIVNDKPFASSNLLRALAEKDPNCEWLICTHADENSATWATKHRKITEPMSYTYTRERAELNGMFTGKNAHNWKTKTTEMLEKTAGAKGCRRWYPASTLGLHIPEELGDND